VRGAAAVDQRRAARRDGLGDEAHADPGGRAPRERPCRRPQRLALVDVDVDEVEHGDQWHQRRGDDQRDREQAQRGEHGDDRNAGAERKPKITHRAVRQAREQR